MKRTIQSSVLAIGFFACTAAYADVWLVDPNGPINGDGLDWSTAFADLQEAIEFAKAGDEIWVRQGLHQPTIAAAGSADSGYLLKDGIGIYGGFSGTETDRSQRDPATNVTTLSAGLSTEVLHVIEAEGVGPSTIIDGFTISDGTGGDSGIGGVGGAGGGLMLINASPTVLDCIITNNSARIGSGVYIQDGSPEFARCVFLGNRSARSGEGGAIYSTVTQGSPPQTLTVSDSDFSFNSVRQGHFATGNGGAIFTNKKVILSVFDSSFESNYGWHNNTFGNAVVGGAIASLGDGVLIENCSFTNNYSNLGAGIYSAGDIQITQCLFSGNRAVGASTCGGFDCPSDVPDITSGIGGAVFVNAFADAQVDQVTVAYNTAAKSGAGIVAQGSLRNSVLWGNTSPQPCCGEDPLPVSRMQYEGLDVVEYSCIQGLLTAQVGEDPPNPNSFPGSNEENPLFVDPDNADFRLLSGSPAVDAGNNALVVSTLTTDLDGHQRFFDDPGTVDTGPGTPAIVDMGAFELQSTADCIAEFNDDGVLNLQDLFAYLDAFNASDPIADFTNDGIFNLQDLFAYLDEFNAGCK